MRRDNPLLRNRVDEEAEAMASDRQAVLETIKETEVGGTDAKVAEDEGTVA